jgi:hypothetical protein
MIILKHYGHQALCWNIYKPEDSKLVHEITDWRKTIHRKYVAVQLACTEGAIVHLMYHRWNFLKH